MATASTEPALRAASPFHDAILDLCGERGFAALTVDDLCRRAGMGPRAFRRHHADLPDCLTDACRYELDAARRAVVAAQAGLERWRDRLRAGAYVLYRHLWEDERRRRLLFVEARAAGGPPGLLLESGLDAFVELIDEGRAEPTAPPTLTRATAESLGGAIFNQAYIAASRGRPLPSVRELVPILMYTAVLPYVGADAAAAELGREPPPRPLAAPR
jgi:AcrR family transcriptional regulator